MLKTEDFVRTFPVHFRSDRDCEVPVLLDFVNQHPGILSVLDVGAHACGQHYMKEIRPIVSTYDGVDIQQPTESEMSMNHYFVGNFNTMKFDKDYDLVACCSTIEHAGVSTYKGNILKEQNGMFSRCMKASRRLVWISFPVGQPFLFENELSVITEKILDGWEAMAKKSGFRFKQRFFYTQGAQANHPWHEHAKRDVSLKIPYIHYIGNQSICVMEMERES